VAIGGSESDRGIHAGQYLCGSEGTPAMTPAMLSSTVYNISSDRGRMNVVSHQDTSDRHGELCLKCLSYSRGTSRDTLRLLRSSRGNNREATSVQNKKLSIRKIVSYLSDEEAEGGGFWLPNIQRPFVWSEEQIARLFDSIMREYPISTLLVWKTRRR
jgi:hypothetical protein